MAIFASRPGPGWLALALSGAGAILVAAPVAQADRVYLDSGSVLEGKATREGDKVVVHLESGSIRLPAASVRRIERAVTPLEEITRLRSQLAEGAIDERLALADRCHAAQLVHCERQLLEEVIACAPDHADARARLGYVRADGGWVARSELAARARDRQRAERAQSDLALAEGAIAREVAELARKQAELALERERLALEKARIERPASPQWYVPRPGPYTLAQPTFSAPPTMPYAINGVRLPSEQGSSSMPGVRPLQSYFR